MWILLKSATDGDVSILYNKTQIQLFIERAETTHTLLAELPGVALDDFKKFIC